jgi:hypothetical protein
LTANSKPVKQEVNGTVLLPTLVFPDFRFENIGQAVRIAGLITRPEDNVEIFFKNVTKGVVISGDISGPELGRNGSAAATKTSVVVKISETSNATLDSLVVDGGNVDFRLEMTSGSKFSIYDSYFRQLSKSAFEIFGVGQVEIVHSEFLNVTSGAVVVDADVKVVNVVESILENDVVVRIFFMLSHFVDVLFCQITVLSTCCLINLLFWQRAFPLCLLAILATGLFVHTSLCPKRFNEGKISRLIIGKGVGFEFC